MEQFKFTGARVLQGDSQSSPPAYAQKGILAGCPVAPALSKVALFPVCKQVHQAGIAAVLDVWIDDISADVEHFDEKGLQALLALQKSSAFQ